MRNQVDQDPRADKILGVSEIEPFEFHIGPGLFYGYFSAVKESADLIKHSLLEM